MSRAYDKTSVIKDTNPFYIVNVILLLYSPYAEHKFKWMSHKINENPFSFFFGAGFFFVIFAPRSRTREEKRYDALRNVEKNRRSFYVLLWGLLTNRCGCFIVEIMLRSYLKKS